MLLNGDYLTVGYANDRSSNTGIVGFSPGGEAPPTRASTQPMRRKSHYFSADSAYPTPYL
jgi:hypothetical protein